MSRLYKKDVNFFNNVKNVKKRKNHILSLTVTLHLSFACVAVGSYAVAELEKQSYEELLQIYNNITTQDEINRIQENKEVLNNLESRNQAYQDMINMYNEERYLSVHLLEVIEDLQSSDVIIDRFNYSNGIISLHARSLSIREGALYAERLLLSGYFEDVMYRGISTQGADSGYSYNLILFIGDDNIENIQ